MECVSHQSALKNLQKSIGMMTGIETKVNAGPQSPLTAGTLHCPTRHPADVFECLSDQINLLKINEINVKQGVV